MPQVVVSTTQVVPLQDRVLVQRLLPGEVMRGLIVIPDAVTEAQPPQEARVIAVGEGRNTDTGEVVPMHVQPGDLVLLGKYAGTEIKVDGEPFYLVREDDILALVKETG